MATGDSTPLHRCTKCGAETPYTTEFYYRDKHAPSGLRSDCRACNLAKATRFRNEHLEASRARELRYNATHRAERANYIRQLRRDRPEYENMHRDKQRRQAWKQAWYAANPDKITRYKRKDSAQRRAHKAQSPGAYEPKDIQTQYASQKGKCWWCGKPVGGDYHVDHRIPLSRGGTNLADNIVISCPKCNLSKGAKLPSEWIGRLL